MVIIWAYLLTLFSPPLGSPKLMCGSSLEALKGSKEDFGQREIVCHFSWEAGSTRIHIVLRRNTAGFNLYTSSLPTFCHPE